MAIAGVGFNTGSNVYYSQKSKMNSKKVQNSFGSSTGIHLHMNDGNNGDKALTSVGFPDGSSISVFSGESNGQYKIKCWNDNKNETEYSVDIQNVGSEDASYLEMLALSTHLDITGQTQNAFGNFISAARGMNGNLTYDTNSIDDKYNFKSLIAEFMQFQYKVGNLPGYMSVKNFYDHLDSSFV